MPEKGYPGWEAGPPAMLAAAAAALPDLAVLELTFFAPSAIAAVAALLGALTAEAPAEPVLMLLTEVLGAAASADASKCAVGCSSHQEPCSVNLHRACDQLCTLTHPHTVWKPGCSRP